jgi:hypothetical protein
MFFGINLNEIFMFPIKDAEARKHLLIGALVALAAFFIPILPYLAIVGYSALIARQVLRGESPRMIAWEDWSGMLTSGLKLFGVRMIYSIPILLLTLPVMLIGFAMPFVAASMDSREAETFFVLFPLIMFGFTCLLIPLSIPLAIIIPAAEIHTVETDNFSAAFQFKDWWGIFRANLSGFLAAFGVYYIAAMLFAIIMQVLMATVILSCLLIVLMPASTIYMSLVMYAAVATAYRDGKAKLAQASYDAPA